MIRGDGIVGMTGLGRGRFVEVHDEVAVDRLDEGIFVFEDFVVCIVRPESVLITSTGDWVGDVEELPSVDEALGVVMYVGVKLAWSLEYR